MQVASDMSIFTCICCPLGCQLEVTMSPDGTVEEVEGNTCRRGMEYAIGEATNPVRMISAIVPVEGCLEPVSVKTARPVPKKQMHEVLAAITDLKLKAPITAGDVFIEDVCDTGVEVIATKSVP